jgi:myosin heavy chain 6/7
LLVEADPKLYHFISQGVITIDSIDDAEEMILTDDAINILGFTEEEKRNMFKCVAAIMHFGNSKWKQRPREEQAEADGTQECEKVAHLLGVQPSDLIKALLKPRIKVAQNVNFSYLIFTVLSLRLVMIMLTKVKIKIKL